jgi:hypothetical protein
MLERRKERQKEGMEGGKEKEEKGRKWKGREGNGREGKGREGNKEKKRKIS